MTERIKDPPVVIVRNPAGYASNSGGLAELYDLIRKRGLGWSNDRRLRSESGADMHIRDTPGEGLRLGVWSTARFPRALEI